MLALVVGIADSGGLGEYVAPGPYCFFAFSPCVDAAAWWWSVRIRLVSFWRQGECGARTKHDKNVKQIVHLVL